MAKHGHTALGFRSCAHGNFLCNTCHHLYDSPYPKWVALPEDLGRFIQFERDDYDVGITASD